jgi:hypothetical protein
VEIGTRKADDGTAGIPSVGSIGRRAVTFMLNASLRNVSIRESLESPASAGGSFQSKYRYDDNLPRGDDYS